MTTHSAEPAGSRSSRALSTTSGPMPAGSPTVIAILGRLNCSPRAEAKRINESIVLAEASGFSDHTTTGSITSFNDAPGNAWRELTEKMDRRGMKRFQRKCRSIATREDESLDGALCK